MVAPFGNGLISSGVMIHSSVFVEATASGDFECVAVAPGARLRGS